MIITPTNARPKDAAPDLPDVLQFMQVPAGDLAAILHVHPSTLTGVLQRLVAQRWLLRVDDLRDRRRAVLRLTARGAPVNAATRGTVESEVASTLEGVTARDRAATRRVLERLAHHLASTVAKGRAPQLSRKPDRRTKKGV
jgi:DNA-binding MarR family transcriptional regulator